MDDERTEQGSEDGRKGKQFVTIWRQLQWFSLYSPKNKGGDLLCVEPHEILQFACSASIGKEILKINKEIE